jgi:subtilisin
MTKRSTLVWTVLLLLAAGALGGCTLEEAEDLFFESYIVKLDAEPAAVTTAVNEIQTDFSEIFEFEPLHIFENATQGFSLKLPIGLSEELADMFDEIDYIIIDPPEERAPEPPSDEAPDFNDDNVPDGIAFINGPWGVDTSGIGVAVVDTGIDLDHPDLNVVDAYDAVGEAGGEDSGGDDLNGHGTHVAGTIGGIGNGVYGAAPGVDLYAVRVLDSAGSGTIADIIAGLEYVLSEPGINVVNMSLGGASDPSPPQPLQDAIEALEAEGVAVCIAAGNEGSDTNGFIPAGYDVGIVVSAYDAQDGAENGYASFSNYGNAVDIAAPGVNITSTWPDGEYAAISGTSMATPHVAGVAAAYMAANPGASAYDTYDALIAGGRDGYSGQGGDHPEPLLDIAGLQ